MTIQINRNIESCGKIKEVGTPSIEESCVFRYSRCGKHMAF